MAVPFTQLVAATYDDVITERNKAADQWSDSSFLKYLESKGGVKRTPGGATLQPTLDYRSNTLTDFLATDVTATGITKTDVITAASYGWATLVTPVNWSLTDEALNSEPNQKIDLVTGLVNNALSSHDQAVENGMFAATPTDGFNTLQQLADPPAVNTPIGTIDPAVETWWANQRGLWLDASLLADLTTVWNKVAKGSSGRTPNVIVCSATSHAVLEGKMVPQQRYTSDDSTGRAGFKALQFKTSDVVFSMGCTVDSFYMFNTMDLKLYVVSSAWRERRQPVEFTDHAMMNMKIFSVLQLATNCRSRVGVAKKGP